jgi:hypothetical protein
MRECVVYISPADESAQNKTQLNSVNLSKAGLTHRPPMQRLCGPCLATNDEYDVVTKMRALAK